MWKPFKWIKSWFCEESPTKQDLIELLQNEMKYNDSLQICLVALMVNKNIYEFEIQSKDLEEGIFDKFIVKYEAITREGSDEPGVRVYLATQGEESENELQ